MPSKALESRKGVDTTKDQSSQASEDLTSLEQFASHLEKNVCTQLDVPTESMAEILNHLGEFVRVLDAATAQPHTVSAPEHCGIVGEATLRARFGIKFASQACNEAILEKLKDVFEQGTQACQSAKRIYLACKEIAALVRECSDGASLAVRDCKYLDKVITGPTVHRIELSSANLRPKLDLAAFNKHANKVANLPGKVEPVIIAIQQHMAVIQGFVDSAGKAVKHAFLIPFPLSIAQSILIGESPTLKRKMLREIEALEDIDLYQVITDFQTAIENVKALRVRAAEESLEKLASNASRHFQELDAVVHDADNSASPIGKALLSVIATRPGSPTTDDLKPSPGGTTAVHSACTLNASAAPAAPSPHEGNDPIPVESQECRDHIVPGVTLPEHAERSSDHLSKVQQCDATSTADSIGQLIDEPASASISLEIDECDLATTSDGDTLSPQMIEDLVSASMLHETFASWPKDLATEQVVHENTEEQMLGACPQGDGI